MATIKILGTHSPGASAGCALHKPVIGYWQCISFNLRVLEQLVKVITPTE